MKLIVIRLGLKPKTHPLKVGDFSYSERYDAYIWEQREFKPAEFNEFADGRRWKQLLDDHGSLITVRAVNIKDMAKARAASPNGRAKLQTA